MRGAAAAGGFQGPRWGRLPRRRAAGRGSGRGRPPKRTVSLGPRAYRAGSGLDPARRSPPGSAGVCRARARRKLLRGRAPTARPPCHHQLPATLRLAGHHGKPGAGRWGGTSAFARGAGARPRPCRHGDAAGAGRARSAGRGWLCCQGRPVARPQGRARKTRPASVGTTPGRLGHRGLIRKARRGLGSQGRGSKPSPGVRWRGPSEGRDKHPPPPGRDQGPTSLRPRTPTLGAARVPEDAYSKDRC